jgi:copper homeostasis protein (lipoprotein)
MKAFLYSISFMAAIAVMALFSCSGNQTQTSTESDMVSLSAPDMAHNSRNSLDWYGVYQGTTPCADCEGIETSITLKRDGTFKRSLKYLGKDDNPFYDEGEFEWNDEGSKITIAGESGTSQMYQVGENVLFHLDQDGNRITGDLENMYRLAKNRVDYNLEDKEWVLVELRGNPVERNEDKKEGSLRFDMETGMFSGNNTCNNFFGQYELMEGDRIKFGRVGATLMACPDGELESIFMEVLEMTDNYNVVDGILSLNRARMAPLARFELKEND